MAHEDEGHLEEFAVLVQVVERVGVLGLVQHERTFGPVMRTGRAEQAGLLQGHEHVGAFGPPA
ncbi:hypothetical protein ACZ90_04435 [Streptomyces albus subsp. albus]|nr:hypothetical protein ACZ90_04435 [Streptomyces albus subsp. albus]